MITIRYLVIFFVLSAVANVNGADPSVAKDLLPKADGIERITVEYRLPDGNDVTVVLRDKSIGALLQLLSPAYIVQDPKKWESRGYVTLLPSDGKSTKVSLYLVTDDSLACKIGRNYFGGINRHSLESVLKDRAK